MEYMSIDGINRIEIDILGIVDTYMSKVNDKHGNKKLLQLVRQDILENFTLHRKTTNEIMIERAIKILVTLTGHKITKEDIKALLED